ncbi:hypothetical protein BC831DRAFT_470697 [Entophlyctis helioformis]|nr:hypothetical protein BC831DRAFT_470697 [Entophlyctis helioformis]
MLATHTNSSSTAGTGRRSVEAGLAAYSTTTQSPAPQPQRQPRPQPHPIPQYQTSQSLAASGDVAASSLARAGAAAAALAAIAPERLSIRPAPALRPMYEINPRKVVDPRTRAKLNMDHQSPLVSNGRLPASDSTSSSILDHPGSLSSQVLHKQMQTVARSSFDPVSAMASVMVADPDEVLAIMSKVTSKSLNAGRQWSQYANLVQLDSAYRRADSSASHCSAVVPNTSETVSHHRTMPRAKKVVSEAWLTSLEDKPDASEFLPLHLEVDTISLPYPELQDNPFTTVYASDGPLIGSFDLNFEDYHRWMVFDQPITSRDFALPDSKPHLA